MIVEFCTHRDHGGAHTITPSLKQFTVTGGSRMVDPKSQGLLHVVLTPAAGQGGELEVCHIEPVGPQRAEELLELFAEVSAGGQACHGAADVPCPICSGLQRDLVAEALRRAFWKM
jgi:hypothetical protein